MMELKDKSKMVKIPADTLIHALRIIGEFRDTMKDTIQEDYGLLVMSSDFENLETAFALLSDVSWPKDCHWEDNIEKLALAKPETRRRVKDCYARLEAVKPNTNDGSAMQAACLQLQASLFTVLNMAYKDREVQSALAKSMSAAKFGLEVASGMKEAGAEAFQGDYMNPGGQMLTDEDLEALVSLLSDLCPSIGCAEQGDDPQSVGGDLNAH